MTFTISNGDNRTELRKSWIELFRHCLWSNKYSLLSTEHCIWARTESGKRGYQLACLQHLIQYTYLDFRRNCSNKKISELASVNITGKAPEDLPVSGSILSKEWGNSSYNFWTIEAAHWTIPLWLRKLTVSWNWDSFESESGNYSGIESDHHPLPSWRNGDFASSSLNLYK